MDVNYHISKYCIIQDNKIYVNDDLAFSAVDGSFSSFIKAAFKAQEIDYPKFYKMDNLSKLAFLAAEVLLKEEEKKANIGLILSNKSGSLDSDVKHQESIQEELNYFPSPAVFVYTLANICAGEISIRHGMKSENMFLVSKDYDAETIINSATYLLLQGKADKVLCGWVELFADKYKAVLYLVENIGVLPHNIKSIEKLFLK